MVDSLAWMLALVLAMFRIVNQRALLLVLVLKQLLLMLKNALLALPSYSIKTS